MENIRTYGDVFLTEGGLARNEDGLEFCAGPYRRTKLVEGVGINDFPYITSTAFEKKVVIWKPYQMWTGMLHRGFNQERKAKCPTYRETTVCDEWLSFSGFLQWLFKQPFNNSSWHLDKDLMGDSKVYSPANCVLVPREVNSFLAIKTKNKGTTRLGVVIKGRSIGCCIQISGKPKMVWGFSDAISAHHYWWESRVEHLHTMRELLDRIHPELFNKMLVKLATVRAE